MQKKLFDLPFCIPHVESEHTNFVESLTCMHSRGSEKSKSAQNSEKMKFSAIYYTGLYPVIVKLEPIFSNWMQQSFAATFCVERKPPSLQLQAAFRMQHSRGSRPGSRPGHGRAAFGAAARAPGFGNGSQSPCG
jgi:hypothetical protein